MQTYHFKPEIESIKNGEIFTANSGKGYVQNSELHITENDYHCQQRKGGRERTPKPVAQSNH